MAVDRRRRVLCMVDVGVHGPQLACHTHAVGSASVGILRIMVDTYAENRMWIGWFIPFPRYGLRVGGPFEMQIAMITFSALVSAALPNVL